MTPTEPKPNRQRVEDALADLLEADEHNNSYRYFQAADLPDIDSRLSASMAGYHLPKIETDSPLNNGISVERHTDSQGNPTLWIVQREDK